MIIENEIEYSEQNTLSSQRNQQQRRQQQQAQQQQQHTRLACIDIRLCFCLSVPAGKSTTQNPQSCIVTKIPQLTCEGDGDGSDDCERGCCDSSSSYFLYCKSNYRFAALQFLCFWQSLKLMFYKWLCFSRFFYTLARTHTHSLTQSFARTHTHARTHSLTGTHMQRHRRE